MKAQINPHQSFLDTKAKLMQANLILENSIETPVIKYKINDQEFAYNLNNYLEDYQSLKAQVPSYVSNYSYIYKDIQGLGELISSMKERFKNPENSDFQQNIEFNLEVQMFSKLFSDKIENLEFLRYVYHNAFNEWLVHNLKGMQLSDYNTGKEPGENYIQYDIKLFGNMLYDALITSNSASADEIQLAGQSESADSEHHFDGLE